MFQIVAQVQTATQYMQKLKYYLLKQLLMPETAVRRCSIKKVFLEISQNSQENTCARDFLK